MKIGSIYKIDPRYKKVIATYPMPNKMANGEIISEELTFLTMVNIFKTKILFEVNKSDVILFIGPYKYMDFDDTPIIRDSFMCREKIGFFAIFDGPQDASKILVEIKE